MSRVPDQVVPKIGAPSQRGVYDFGRFEVRPGARQLLIDGEAARLGSRAFDLLLALIERRDRVVGKEELLDLVWPGLVVEENNLQVHISALRRLIGPDSIATVPGRGYQFTALDRSQPGGEHGPSPEPPAPIDSAPGNLPHTLPRLYGREDELARLVDLVTRQRLVTVVGAPGIGKTALALAAAGALRERWSEGVWVVELANIADPAQVSRAVAQALRIALSDSGTPLEQLVGVLQSQTLLLVLDNCEHLVDAAGTLAEAIVQRATGVHVLATSQELLNVPGEVLHKIKPLAVPEAGDLDRADQFGAFRLFVERARAADPRFEIASANAAAVADICRRLDGLPLAIELAAARVRLLGVLGVRDRLGERFKVLTGGARTAMRRHQTLLAAIDWSHALLAPDEQMVLRRLGVFVGGFSLELAQQVTSDDGHDEWAVIDALGTLVDRSLVSVEAGEPPRYRLLETTRAYALEKLAAAGETAALIERHARAVERLFARTEDERVGENGSLSMLELIRRLAPEIDNLRAALGWAIGEPGDPYLAVSLVAASCELFRALGISQELVSPIQRLRAYVDGHRDDTTIAKFLTGMAIIGTIGGLTTAEQLEATNRAETILRQTGPRRRLHHALYAKGWTLMSSGDYDEADRALAQMKAAQDPAWPAWTRGLALNLHGCLRMNQGRFDEALRVLTEQSVLLEHEIGEPGRRSAAFVNICAVLGSMQRYEEVVAIARQAIESPRSGEAGGAMGYVDWMLVGALAFLGRLEEADRTMRRAMPGWRRDGLLPVASGMVAMVLAEQGRLEIAARLRGAALAHFERSGVKPYAYLQTAITRTQMLLQAASLDPAQVEHWEREGAALGEAGLAELCLTPNRP